jgi:hypothetical protein
MSTAQLGEAISHETIVNGMREDGFLPPKTPEWEPQPVRTPPTPPREDRCQVTQHTSVSVTHGHYGYGCLYVHFSGGVNPAWPQDGGDLEQRLATLQFAASEMEKALPVVRAMIRQLDGSSELRDEIVTNLANEASEFDPYKEPVAAPAA